MFTSSIFTSARRGTGGVSVVLEGADADAREVREATGAFVVVAAAANAAPAHALVLAVTTEQVS